MCIVGNATSEISRKLDWKNGSDLRVINVLFKDVDVRIIDGLKRFTELRSARQIFILFHYDLLIVQFQSDRVLLAQNVIKLIELQISVNATKGFVFLSLYLFACLLVCLFCFVVRCLLFLCASSRVGRSCSVPFVVAPFSANYSPKALGSKVLGPWSGV